MEKITKTYSINEVKKATLDYFNSDELARDTWIKKYCLKQNETLFELTPDDMHKRIAKELARIENKYPNPLKEDEIYETIKDFKRIVPQGSPMSGIGNDYQVVSLGNCFSYNTNIITNKGLLPIGSLVDSKPILYSENGQWIESEVKSFGEQEIVKLTLIRNDNIKVIETTSDHVWYVKKYRSDSYHELKTHELKKEYILRYNFAKNYSTYKPSPFGVAHGFYTGDGDKFGNNRIGKRILILEHDKELIPYFTNIQYDDDLKSIHIGSLPNAFKELPDLSENVSYLYGWLAGYFAADGCIDERGSIIINSVNINNIKHIKEVCSILGIGTYDIVKQNRTSNLTKKDSTIYGIRLMSSTLNKSFFIKEVDKNRFIKDMKKSYWRVKDVEYSGIKKTVYCAIVPNTSNFTLEDNILTHNCFVIGNNADSYGGIMRIDEEQAQLMKRRGGVGHDLSKIRPESTPVKNSAITSTGIVPFMERYSNSTKETSQSGRRGALMLSVSIKHPDSEAFIDAKMTEGKITGANVSVRIHDDFMKSALNGNEYVQQYPVDSDKPILKKTINADKIWKKIIHNAWKSAEPGILFWDKIISESIPSCYGKEWTETSTNPCVSEDTLILTQSGYKKISELVNNEINVWNGNNFSKVIPTITGYNQKMMKIIFSDGSEIKCTPYHGFYTWKGFNRDGMVEKKEARDLRVGDKLEKYDFPTLIKHKILDIDKSFYTLGFFAGDGYVKRESTAHISLYGVKRNLLNRLNIVGIVSEDNENDKSTVRVNLPKVNLTLSELKKYVPKYEDNYSSSIMSWLSGIIDSDGSRNSEDGSISISSTDKDFLMDIKLHVLNIMGVNGSVIDEKEGGLKEIKGQIYNTNDSYRLIISAYNVKKLYDLGLRTFRVKIDDVNPNRDSSRFIKVTSIENIEDADKVYCFTEKDRGRGCFSGVVTANCGELPLPPYDSCRLLAINLFGYVENPFTDKAYFNWDLFILDVRKALRYMDDIVDLELEKIDKIITKIDSDPEDEEIKWVERKLWQKIREKAEQGRRTGLGITGEGDMLAGLNLRYGNDDATDFAEKVHKVLKLEAYRSSVNLAKERGAFPIYSAELENDNPFILRIKDEDYELYCDMQQYGRRNIALLTIAPTGTASIMTQTTSGIEPVFLPVYMRRRKINPNEKDVKIDFVDDEGVAWQEYIVFHHKFEIWLKANDYDIDVVKTMSKEQLDEIVKKSPYYKATSNDIDWVKKVEMQGRIQKHIDHSISVTVNLPEDVTEDIVSKVYETGWRSGCKGITVYRDGSRSGVLVGVKEEKIETIQDIHAPKRPKRLKGDIHHFQNALEKWIAVVGIKDGRPYEIFTGKYENGLSKLSSTVTECEIVKNIIEVEELNELGKKVKVRKKRYDIEYVDTNGEKHVHTGLNHAFNPEFWNYAKLISGILRHGMPLNYVHELINSLNFKEDYINTWKKGIGRVIKRYIKDGEKAKGICLECGSSENLEYKEGCLTCMACGSSKCG